jgi:undecaprenyl diphosphate synthase
VDEVRFLMNFNERLLVARRDQLNGKGVRVRFIGRRGGRVPGRVRKRIDETEALTARNRRLTLTFAFNYGGRAELVDAVREIARAAADGTLDPERIDERTVRRHLYTPDMPDPDLMVRTSGEHRISNYLLWQVAYSELHFTDVLWPDFRRKHLFRAVDEYQQRERRFGAV